MPSCCMAVFAHEVIYSISDTAGLLGWKRLQLGRIKVLYGCQQLVRRGTNLGGGWVRWGGGKGVITAHKLRECLLHCSTMID